MGKPFIVMYHGGITNERGIETLIQLLGRNKNLLGIILGNGSDQYINFLHNLAQKQEVQNRLLFHNAVPLSELWKYVGAVDLSLMMISGNVQSYYLSLPNKFFESIQSLTPIVSSDFPEMKNIIDKYGIGLTCDPTDMEAINFCVEKMRTDTMYYKRCKQNLYIAKKDLCWENEKKKLEIAIKQIEKKY